MNNLWKIVLKPARKGPGIMEAVLRTGIVQRATERLVHMATVFTTVGKAWAIDKLDELLQTTGDYIGWGTGAGTAAIGDTTLFTEAAEARVVATRSQQPIPYDGSVR